MRFPEGFGEMVPLLNGSPEFVAKVVPSDLSASDAYARQKESPSYRIVFLRPLLAVKTAATFYCFEFMLNHQYAE